MGYETDFNGTIKLSNKDVEKKLGDFFDSSEYEYKDYFDSEEIIIEDGEINFGGYGKLYGEMLQKICLIIARIDKGATGEVQCCGEEKMDLWRIFVENGKVRIDYGIVTYDEENGEIFENKDVNKAIYRITKDKELLKEIIVEELE